MSARILVSGVGLDRVVAIETSKCVCARDPENVVFGLRSERLELPTLWFEGTQYKTLSIASGVAYRERTIYLALGLTIVG